MSESFNGNDLSRTRSTSSRSWMDASSPSTTGMVAKLLDDPGYLVDLDEVDEVRKVGRTA